MWIKALALVLVVAIAWAVSRRETFDQTKKKTSSKTAAATPNPKALANTSFPMEEDEVLDTAARKLLTKAKQATKKRSKTQHHRVRVPRIPALSPGSRNPGR